MFRGRQYSSSFATWVIAKNKNKVVDFCFGEDELKILPLYFSYEFLMPFLFDTRFLCFKTCQSFLQRICQFLRLNLKVNTFFELL